MDDNPYKSPQEKPISTGRRLSPLLRLLVYLPFTLVGVIFLGWCLWEWTQRPHAQYAGPVMLAALVWTGGGLWLVRNTIREYQESATHL